MRGKGGGLDLGLGFDQAAIGMALVGLDGRFLRVNRARSSAAAGGPTGPAWKS